MASDGTDLANAPAQYGTQQPSTSLLLLFRFCQTSQNQTLPGGGLSSHGPCRQLSAFTGGRGLTSHCTRPGRGALCDHTLRLSSGWPVQRDPGRMASCRPCSEPRGLPICTGSLLSHRTEEGVSGSTRGSPRLRSFQRASRLGGPTLSFILGQLRNKLCAPCSGLQVLSV